MVFKKSNKPKKHTKLYKLQKEKRNTKVIVIGFAITAIVIVGMIAYAFYYDRVLKYNQPVAQVGDLEISGEEFNARVRLERNAYILQYSTYSVQAVLNEGDHATVDYFQNQMLQILSVLDDYDYFGDYVLQRMVDEHIGLIEARNMGLSVSEEEIETTIQELFDYYPEEKPTPTTSAILPTSTLSATQIAILGITPTQIITESSTLDMTPTTQVTSTPTLTITPTNANTPTPVIKNTPTSKPDSIETPQPTATIYSLEVYKQNYRDYIEELEVIGVPEDMFRKYISTFLIHQKLFNEISMQVERNQEQVWARHILVDSQDEAIAVLNRLEGGESWDAIAEELSLDTSNRTSGGDLGWFTKGRMVEQFENAAFEMDIGQISNPIETPYGWHIIQVLGHEVRPLSDIDYERAKNEFYNEWFSNIKENTKIEILPVWKDHVPTEPSISPGMRPQ